MFFNKFRRDIDNIDSSIFWSIHRGGKKKNHVKVGKFCTMSVEDTVYNDIEKLKGISGGCYIPCLNSSVATFGSLCPVWVVLLGAYLTHYFCVRNLFSSFCRYIFIYNDLECFSYRYSLLLEDFVTCPNPLT